ncbi:MAG: Mpo1-like protein [Isosphaeraceae bacterium]
MIEPSLPPDPRVHRWLLRHPNPRSFILHMIGIPPTFLGALFVPIYLCRLSWPLFLLALGLFVGGYLLQFAGHYLEGTDPGEVVYFKRKLGRPYVEFPRPRTTGSAPAAGAAVHSA